MTKFRLQTVLQLRHAERERCRAELAEALRAEQALDEQREQLALQRQNVQQQLRVGSAPGAILVDRLLEVHRYELVLQAQFQLLGQQKTELAAEIQRRQSVLAEAERSVKVLEKLRDRQAERERREALAQEQKRVDDFAQRARREVEP